MEKKKTGGRARQFDPHKAVKVQLFVPENDVAMSVAVAKRAIMKRYKQCRAEDVWNMKAKFEPITIKLSEAGLARLEADMGRKQGIRKDMQEKKLTVEQIEAKWGVTFLKELPYDKETSHEG